MEGLDASRNRRSFVVFIAEQQRSLHPKMGAIRLALLLILAAVGIDSLQPMRANLSNVDRHYYQPNARLQEPVVGLEITGKLTVDGVATSETVGCSYHPGMARRFCWKYGCNSDKPTDWCWLPVYCVLWKTRIHLSKL